jgi:hypothetical protein
MAVSDDLKKAYTVLSGKQSLYTTLWSYYDGDQPLVYSSQRLREVFRGLEARFVQNWCAVVVDSCLDRIQLTGFQVSGDEEAQAALNAAFVATELSLDADDAHLAGLVTGEAFLIAWRQDAIDGEGEIIPDAGEIEAFYNDPRLCHVEYSPDNPLKKLWAAKWWVAVDGRYRLTMYYPDRLEYYASAKPAAEVGDAESFGPDPNRETAPNPFGMVPVFHLRKERRRIKSELENVVTLQDAINKLFADMMVSAEFAAFRQRYIISNADTSSLKNAPNEIWNIPAGDGVGQGTAVGEFGEAGLGNYLTAMDKLAGSVGIITRTPRHYFFNQSGDPSGEALIALEAPLNKKCTRFIGRFGHTWQQMGSFLLSLLGYDVAPESITPQFAKPETVQPRTQAEIRQMNTGAGIPITTSLRDEGRSQEQIDQVLADKAAEAAAGQAGLAKALLDAQRNFDQQSGGKQ